MSRHMSSTMFTILFSQFLNLRKKFLVTYSSFSPHYSLTYSFIKSVNICILNLEQWRRHCPEEASVSVSETKTQTGIEPKVPCKVLCCVIILHFVKCCHRSVQPASSSCSFFLHKILLTLTLTQFPFSLSLPLDTSIWHCPSPYF